MNDCKPSDLQYRRWLRTGTTRANVMIFCIKNAPEQALLVKLLHGRSACFNSRLQFCDQKPHTATTYIYIHTYIHTYISDDGKKFNIFLFLSLSLSTLYRYSHFQFLHDWQYHSTGIPNQKQRGWNIDLGSKCTKHDINPRLWCYCAHGQTF